MQAQNLHPLSFNQDPEETERMLRQLAYKIQNVSDRVKRIGSYSLSMELNEIASNLAQICDQTIVDAESASLIPQVLARAGVSAEGLGPHVQ